jgi:hypothetical protein
MKEREKRNISNNSKNNYICNDNFKNYYFQLWKKMFEPLHCVNFGIGGDQTQHVLWRILNGEMDNVEPKVIIHLMQQSMISLVIYLD